MNNVKHQLKSQIAFVERALNPKFRTKTNFGTIKSNYFVVERV